MTQSVLKSEHIVSMSVYTLIASSYDHMRMLRISHSCTWTMKASEWKWWKIWKCCSVNFVSDDTQFMSYFQQAYFDQ